MDERRREPRKKINIPVNVSLYEIIGADVKVVQMDAYTKDISMKGLGIDLKIRSKEIWEKLNNFSWRKKFYIDLEFVTPEDKIVLSGTIVRCQITNKEKKELRIGIILKELNEKIREEWDNFFKDKLQTTDK
jgi:hypothetical protein